MIFLLLLTVFCVRIANTHPVLTTAAHDNTDIYDNTDSYDNTDVYENTDTGIILDFENNHEKTNEWYDFEPESVESECHEMEVMEGSVQNTSIALKCVDYEWWSIRENDGCAVRYKTAGIEHEGYRVIKIKVDLPNSDIIDLTVEEGIKPNTTHEFAAKSFMDGCDNWSPNIYVTTKV